MKKWLICSWKHKEYRCYAIEWDSVWAKLFGNGWHCTECGPCHRGLTDFLEAMSRKKHRLWAQSLENSPFFG